MLSRPLLSPHPALSQRERADRRYQCLPPPHLPSRGAGKVGRGEGAMRSPPHPNPPPRRGRGGAVCPGGHTTSPCRLRGGKGLTARQIAVGATHPQSTSAVKGYTRLPDFNSPHRWPSPSALTEQPLRCASHHGRSYPKPFAALRLRHGRVQPSGFRAGEGGYLGLGSGNICRTGRSLLQKR
jgi:hypothetical protein